MRGSERVIDIDVAERGKRLTKGLIVFLFAA